MIDHSSIRAHESESAKLDRLTAQFIAGGGCIQQLPLSATAPAKPHSYNTSIARRRNARREFDALETEIAEHGRALAATGLTIDLAVRQLNKRWGGRVRLTCDKASQIAARYGYAYREKDPS